MKRVFLDANVLFSASAQGSGFEKLFDLIVACASPVTSDFALEEARRNILSKRPERESGFRRIQETVQVVSSALFPLAIELEDNDIPILCSAIRSECDYLVTGDKRHFGAYYGRTIEGVTVLPPIELARRLTDEND